jgi:ATPase subunit of ABC transporter with duplicated ATPase domains
LGLTPLAGKLAGRCVVGDNFKLNVHRARAAFAPETAWLKALQAVGTQWQPCAATLKQLCSAGELQADVRQFQDWRTELQNLAQRFSTVKQHQGVIFIGPSGAGKSKLISNLLGDADVLPSAGEGSAVTAAPIEIRFQQRPADFATSTPGTMPQYSAQFELFEVKEFEEMRDQMTRALLAITAVTASAVFLTWAFEHKRTNA